MTTIDKAATLERVREIGLLAMLRAPDPDGARRAIDALVERASRASRSPTRPPGRRA